MDRPISPHRRGKALDQVDDIADLLRDLDGKLTRLDEWPWFAECREAWANAKGRGFLFGWSEFPQFLEEMSKAAPRDGSKLHKLVVIDPTKEFVRGNVGWQPYASPFDS